MFETFTDAATRWVGSTASIILHTIFFVVIFGLLLLGVALDTILLVLTTAVSLEAIYLALFIQRSVNMNTVTLAEAAEDIEDIGEDIEEVGKDLDELEEDIDQISEDVDDLSEDIEEVGKDLDELEEDIDKMQIQSKPKSAAGPSVQNMQKDITELKIMIADLSAKLENSEVRIKK